MRALCLALLLVPAVAAAQREPVEAGVPAGGAAVSDTLASALDAPTVGLTPGATASVLTMLPGREVYSLFGHTALRIRDDAAGIDRTYNYGTFDFEQPGFLLRFARGRLDYQLTTTTTPDELARYAWLGRGVFEQTLALDAPTVRALYDLLEVNALPENRAYRYDFLFDNCSTRPLDMIAAALVQAGRPPLTLAPLEAPHATFRDRLAPYLVGTPLVELGIRLGLGVPVDRAPTPREATFLPLDLAAALDGATVGGRPLVARTDTLVRTPNPTMPREAVGWPLALAALVLAASVALALMPRARTAARVFDAALFAAVGVAGVVLVLLAVATEHVVTRPNWNLAWAWPTHGLAAVALARTATGPRAWRAYLWATTVVAGMVAAGALVDAVPQPLPYEAAVLALALAVRAGVRAKRS